MADLDRTIADAQAFIDSMKEFHNDKHGSVHHSGSDSTGSDDHPFQNDLTSNEGMGSREIPNSISFGTNPDHSTARGSATTPSRNSLNGTLPVGNKNGFRTLEFTQSLRIELLTFVEVYYYENKRLPEVHVLHEHFKGHPDRPNFLKGWTTVLDSISDSLSNRGIKPYNTVDNYIDPKFAWATSLIVNHLDKRTIPAKLKEAGLSTKEWQAFLRRKRHYDYFQTRLDEVFTQDVKNDAKIALSRSIQNGDLQAIKYYNELQNIYRPETQSAIQMVSIVLTAVMEILAQNVTSDVLNRIAAEIRSSPTVQKVIEAKAQ